VRRAAKLALGLRSRMNRCSPSRIWRDIDEWGPACSMVMTEACVDGADVHGRMPVILRRQVWRDWLDGPPDVAGLLCRPYPELMMANRTADPRGAALTRP
jgi:putative SOS response-associated peptidase YedK